MKETAIRELLLAMRDDAYKEFNSKLLPGIDKKTIIGIRVPKLRELAKNLKKEEGMTDFFELLPHQYLEENILHGLLLSEQTDYPGLIKEVERFLPFVDNWQVCDLLSPKIFKKQRKCLKEEALAWMKSAHPYTVRFGIKMLMDHYLDSDFEEAFLSEVGSVKSEEYYVNMMVAWYFATALAKQWDAALPYIKERRLSLWLHRKSIQKAVESRRISSERKDLLRSLRPY